MKKLTIVPKAALSIKTQFLRHAKALARATTAAAHRVANTLKGLWDSHEEQMETSDLYRAMVIAITAALARQVNLHRLVLTIISALMNAYTATRDRANPDRHLRRPFEDPDDDGWAYA